VEDQSNLNGEFLAELLRRKVMSGIENGDLRVGTVLISHWTCLPLALDVVTV
jgi:hypothetical protein